MAQKRDQTVVSRRGFLGISGPVTAGVLSLGTGLPQAATNHKEESSPLKYGLRNQHFSLSLSTDKGLETLLKHLPSGIELANGRYNCSLGEAKLSTPVKTTEDSKIEILSVKGSIQDAILLKHEFRFPASLPWFEERFTITNRSSYPLDLSQVRSGFVLPVPMGPAGAGGPLKEFRFTAVPYRREPSGDRKQYADYALAQILTESRSSRLRSDFPLRRDGTVVMTTAYETGIPQTEFPVYASEGWIFTDGKNGFLITKYNQQGMEWSLLSRIPVGADRAGLCWGGFGVFQGDPQPVINLPPGQSYSFGVSRLTAFQGGMEEGFYAFRAEMESRGHGCPRGFDPPLHWNELYDNKLWHLGMIEMDKPENRRKYYQLPDMIVEAKKARDYSCEALYLDPGWDTSFASKIWDESRLGKLKEFTEKLRTDYGLKLSLHTPLTGWCNPASYSRDAERLNRDGSRAQYSLCVASKQYLDETISRFEALARDGASFFMFDGTMYHGECWAQSLNSIIRHADVVKMANFTTMTSLLSSDPKKRTFKSPLFYTFKLFSNNCRGNSIDTYVQCDTFNTEKFKGIPFLDVTSVYSKETNTVFVNVINRHQDKAITADILNTTGNLSGKAEVSLINSDSLKETFSIDKQSQYIPVVTQVQVDKNKLTWTFPPHSFTQIRIEVMKK